jgi:hypothetical protein
VREIEL